MNVADTRNAQPAAGADAEARHREAQAKQARTAAELKRPVDEDEGDDEDKEVPGTYNPVEYANLAVGQEVKDLFEYI